MSEKGEAEYWAMGKAWEIAYGGTHSHIFNRDHFIVDIIRWLAEQYPMVIISKCREGWEIICVNVVKPTIRVKHETLVGAMCDAVMGTKEPADDLQATAAP